MPAKPGVRINGSTIYLQVGNDLKGKIASGQIQPGEKLPSGRELAQQYQINPNTAARVYQVLEQEGICETRRGLGTFVVEEIGMQQKVREEMARDLARSFLERMRALGLSCEEIGKILKEEENE